MEFPSHCSACSAPCSTRMHKVEIPFFKVRLNDQRLFTADPVLCISEASTLNLVQSLCSDFPRTAQTSNGSPMPPFRSRIILLQEVIIMADSCDVCGYRNSEVKGAGGVSPQGRICTLKVTTGDDLKRDVLKSETASVSVPELELEVTTGTLGGLITTAEGLLAK